MNDSADLEKNQINQWLTKIEELERAGVYRPEDEHDNCGVGIIAQISGDASRHIVELGLSSLKALWHRGAVGADGKTGDGAGILLQIPQEFMREQIRKAGTENISEQIAVGMIFLPREDILAQEECRTLIESEIIKYGHKLLGWRQVPVNTEVIGERAAVTRPEVEQIMIRAAAGVEDEDLERQLYLIRRGIEKKALENNLVGLYICSLSCRTIVYKGMVLAEHLDDFYLDLKNESFVSNYAIYHQRYSTNTFPKWSLAQPFRTLAHNGEINTLRGNIMWMKVHEKLMASDKFGKNSDVIKPIIQPGSSDSAALDAAFEVTIRAGRSLPLAKSMIIPEAWRKSLLISDELRYFYQYCDSMMKPWDGPAAIAATDGNWIVAGTDRNGLRPMRYSITQDGLFVAGSESGIVHLPAETIVEKGRLGPGEMIAINRIGKKLYRDSEIKKLLANEKSYKDFTSKIVNFNDVVKTSNKEASISEDYLLRRQLLASYTREEMELILEPMVRDAKEPIGSMGDDTAPAVLSEFYHGFHHYFRQNFSQVTNPPIDSLREKRVMSLTTHLGNLGNVLDEECLINEILVLESPILNGSEFNGLIEYMGTRVKIISTGYIPSEDEKNLRQAIERIIQEAEIAINEGCDQIVLSDRKLLDTQAPVPIVLAMSALHLYLVEKGNRSSCSLNSETSECLDVHHCTLLVGVGATTVYPWLAEESIYHLHKRGRFPELSKIQCVERFKEAVNQGILKIMSKMGISVITSFRGGYNFEAFGLSRSLVAEYFFHTPSRISGIGLRGLDKKIFSILKEVNCEERPSQLNIGGLYRIRAGADRHSLTGNYIHMLQSAVNKNSFGLYSKATKLLNNQNPINLRDLLTFENANQPLKIENVESITSLRKRFLTPGMSLGALSPEAHETLNIAMNRIGARSVSGEGGEDPKRYTPYSNGDNANSAVKQVASGRFGVTAEYLNQCSEIEIKVAQGAKPGEGGQLPGFKVTAEIARIRNSTEGVTLISPPPHHDVYSIEDLAQLIFDLKQINPRAKVCVKLVSRSGVGAIACGVAKAKADIISISGSNGGTGASARSSLVHAGLPWEVGLSEAHQLLSVNNLRNRVTLRVDGGIKTGRDIIVGSMLGAEEFGIGTASLVAMGCLMVRQCQSNVCPVGICTQNAELRKKFEGTPEKVINLFTFIAVEVRYLLAEFGIENLQNLVGRVDLLTQTNRGNQDLDDLDLNSILIKGESSEVPNFWPMKKRNPVSETLDHSIIADAAAFFSHGEKMELAYNVRNTDRTIGARLSSQILQAFAQKELQVDHLKIQLRGTAGQSLGAFAVKGLKLVVTGDANDYVGKGLSGGTIVLKSYRSSKYIAHQNTIIGNTVLYGATSGNLFAAGQAGERFAVRNSGANAVIEGCGANGCEYMTGGTIIILGGVGENFGAGMTGGMAFIYDPQDDFQHHCNTENVFFQRLASQKWEKFLKTFIEQHVIETESLYARELINNWDKARKMFWQVCPYEMRKKLDWPLGDSIDEG